MNESLGGLQLGIAATSFGGALYGAPKGKTSDEAKQQAAATIPRVPGAPGAKHADTLEFVERCHGLGAAGVQTHINGDLGKVRAKAEELGFWIEGMTAFCESTPEQFEDAILRAKAAGCSVARDAVLSGRRYESFASLDEWKAWVRQRLDLLERIVPILEKHRFTLALENHKDWTIDEYVALFQRFSSEYLRACLDFGNNIALCEEPMPVIERAAKYAVSTHFKDMALAQHPEGFAMSEVRLGNGVLDLERIVSTLRAANPQIRFSLEMITRDPLVVRCRADEYWRTFPERRERYLPSMLSYVSENASTEPLPTVDHLTAGERAQLEEENIRACIVYARQKFG